MPPLTVASLATTSTVRPETEPTPVTMPPAGTSSSYMPPAASGESSRNGVSGSRRRAMRSRTSSLPPGLVALPGPRRTSFLGPAQALAEVFHQRLVVRARWRGRARSPAWRGWGPGAPGRRPRSRRRGALAGHGWPSWTSGWASGWTSASKERAMTWRLISLVPSPISLIFTWRQ